MPERLWDGQGNPPWPVGPGVTLVCGGDGVGKTTLLRRLADWHRHAGSGLLYWEDPTRDGEDRTTPRQHFAQVAERYPAFDAALLDDLVQGFALEEHLDKGMYMLSTGSRRKVWLAAGFASGAELMLIDQPFAALDIPSQRLLTELLQEAAEHPTRAWWVADYEAPAGVALARVIDLGDVAGWLRDAS